MLEALAALFTVIRAPLAFVSTPACAPAWRRGSSGCRPADRRDAHGLLRPYAASRDQFRCRPGSRSVRDVCRNHRTRGTPRVRIARWALPTRQGRSSEAHSCARSLPLAADSRRSLRSIHRREEGLGRSTSSRSEPVRHCTAGARHGTLAPKSPQRRLLTVPHGWEHSHEQRIRSSPIHGPISRNCFLLGSSPRVAPQRRVASCPAGDRGRARHCGPPPGRLSSRRRFFPH